MQNLLAYLDQTANGSNVVSHAFHIFRSLRRSSLQDIWWH